MTTQASITFKNFDDEESFAHYENRVKDPAAQNFIIDFCEQSAHIAFDIANDQALWENLLKKDRTKDSTNTRWINIWAPYRQQHIVSAIANHYEFSQRLSALMHTVP